MIRSSLGATTWRSSGVRKPSAIKIRDALGESWMPAPTSSRRCAWSNTATLKPRSAIAKAAVSPPMPAPATRTVREDGKARAPGLGGLVRQRAFRRASLVVERGIVTEQRRAIGADDLGRVAHVEIDMRVVKGRQFALAHEFVRPDLDHRHARRVVKVGNDLVGHGCLVARAGGTISIRRTDA